MKNQKLAFLYVIAHPRGWRKIGFSNVPLSRLQYLQKHCGHLLRGEVVFAISGKSVRALEQAVHREIHRLRITNEWFDIDLPGAKHAICKVASELKTEITEAAFPGGGTAKTNKQFFDELSQIPRRTGRCPAHPGELLRDDILPALHMSKVDVADALGISRQHLYDILSERKPVSPEVAVRLGAAFGDGPEVWLRMQAAYDAFHASRSVDVRKVKVLSAA